MATSAAPPFLLSLPLLMPAAPAAANKRLLMRRLPGGGCCEASRGAAAESHPVAAETIPSPLLQRAPSCRRVAAESRWGSCKSGAPELQEECGGAANGVRRSYKGREAVLQAVCGGATREGVGAASGVRRSYNGRAAVLQGVRRSYKGRTAELRREGRRAVSGVRRSCKGRTAELQVVCGGAARIGRWRCERSA